MSPEIQQCPAPVLPLFTHYRKHCKLVFTAAAMLADKATQRSTHRIFLR
jgi:hypothetical protein